MKHPRNWLVATLTLAMVCALAAPAGAQPIKLDDTAFFIEINDTDGDAGVQLFLDGEGWRKMKAFAPDGTKILDVRASSSIGLQGITEFFFESAEPSFEEQSLAELLALFPEGKYRFKGRTTDGERLIGKAFLTHALPDAPVLLSPEEEDDTVDPDDTVLEWMTVDDPPGSSIVKYEVVVEREDGALRVFKADVEPDVTSITVPSEFMEAGTAYKFEVLAVEESGNQTISEREFETAE